MVKRPPTYPPPRSQNRSESGIFGNPASEKSGQKNKVADRIAAEICYTSGEDNTRKYFFSAPKGHFGPPDPRVRVRPSVSVPVFVSLGIRRRNVARGWQMAHFTAGNVPYGPGNAPRSCRATATKPHKLCNPIFLACGHALGGGGATLVVTKVAEKIIFSDISKTKSGLQIAIESGLGDFSAQKHISGDPKILGPKWSTKKSRKFFTSKPPKMVNPTP